MSGALSVNGEPGQPPTKLGIPLGELFLLSDLADWLREHGRSRFLFTAPPLRLPGAVGSPVTGVGTV